MIRCNNCMSTFENEEELSQIVEQREFYEGAWHTTDRFIYEPTMDLNETEDKQYEIFRGCPYCLGDEDLMDLVPYEEGKINL